MNQSITKSFKDIFSPTVLYFVAKITILSIAVTAVIIWIFKGLLISFITSYLSWIPWEWVQTTGASVATIALAYMLFIMVLSIMTSLMVEPLLIQLAKKHYPDTPVVGTANVSTSVLLSLKSGFIFLILFLFTFPVMFIPLVGAVWMLWLWSILLKAPTIYDVSSLFITDKKEIKEKTKKSTLMAMVAAGFNYVPVVNIFAPVFAQILFLHHILRSKKV
ncbi:MAG TPA: hypothetical protein EYG78_00610 [Sulfurovum sp.]|nr:hypothetical protein [Sulfurovum sp.]